jgi:DMSO/TMAO reductase YedYZ molybdopterin-dependent catalytic subunit
MRPRATDWSLALATGAAFATGLWTLTVGRPEGWWVFAIHGATGYLTLLLLIPKLARVRNRLLPGIRSPRAWAGLGTTALALLTIGCGIAWVLGGSVVVFGYNLLNWHILFGLVLTVALSAHMVIRAKPLRSEDRSRRQALRAGAFALGAALIWPLQERLTGGLGLPGAQRRFTGSREVASFSGNGFPVVSWMADQPAPLDVTTWRLRVTGLVAEPFAISRDELDARDELTATLDCTGGFYTTQHWSGTRVGALLDRAGVLPEARWVRFVSITGYRWSLPLEQARETLIAARVGDEPLSHGHGAPARLVAPGERGFVWVKWLALIEVRAEPDPGQLLAINVSGFTGADDVRG